MGAYHHGIQTHDLCHKAEHLAHWTMTAVGDIGLKVQYKLAHVRYTPARA